MITCIAWMQCKSLRMKSSAQSTNERMKVKNVFCTAHAVLFYSILLFYTIKSKFCAEKYTHCVYQQWAASYCVSVISCFIVSTLVLWQVLFSVLRGSSTAMCDYSIWVSFDIWRFQPSVWMSDSITLCFCTLTHIWYPRSYKNMFPGLFLNPVKRFTFVSLVLESLMSRYVV